MKHLMREQFREVIQKMGLLEEQQTKCCELSLVQCHVLTEVGMFDGQSVNELAEKLNLDKSTTSRHITNLVKYGLVDRLENTEDRRYFTLHLTPSGKETYLSIESTMDDYYEKLLQSLTKSEQEEIEHALDLLNKAISGLGCC
jgi:DNA-binding MarR family transcriptional regulator